MSAFIQQFYHDIPPPDLILTNVVLSDGSLYMAALQSRHQKKVLLKVPQRGAFKQVLEHALKNASQALEKHLSYRWKEDDIWQKISEFFKINKVPQTIEFYDNSHLRGHCPVSAMIVASAQGFCKKSYRLFSVEEKNEDDCQMMREVIRKRLCLPHRPEVLMIDGGKGQLSSVNQVLREENINDVVVIAMSKGINRKNDIFYQNGVDTCLSLPFNSPLLFALQRMRDEAHRFAITAHRQKRKKQAMTSILEEIESVGNERRKALLEHFGSVKAIANAHVSDLQKVPGISKNLSQKIYDFFQEKK